MTTQDDARRAAVAISDFEDDPKAPCPACGGNQTYCSCTIESMRAAIILKHLATPAAQPAPAEGREAFEAQHPGWDFEKDALGNYFSERTKWGWSEWQNGAAFQAARAGTAQGADWVAGIEAAAGLCEKAARALGHNMRAVALFDAASAIRALAPSQGERAGLSVPDDVCNGYQLWCECFDCVEGRAEVQIHPVRDIRVSKYGDPICKTCWLDMVHGGNWTDAPRLAPTLPHSPDGERE